MPPFWPALLADGATLERSLRQLADDWPKDDKIPAGVKVRAETYKGMALYAVSLPTPDRRLTSLVGKTLDVAVAVAGDKLLVAAGRDAVANLRKAFDQLQHAPAQEVPPLRIRLAVPAMAKIVALTSKNQQIRAAAAMLAGFSASAGSKNHVSFTVTPIPGGVRAVGGGGRTAEGVGLAEPIDGVDKPEQLLKPLSETNTPCPLCGEKSPAYPWPRWPGSLARQPSFTTPP